MTSFQISLTPHKRAAGRFVADVTRALQKAFVEEKERRGLTQSDIARTLGVHRSVINRQLRGTREISLSRAAELAFAMGRKASFQCIDPIEGRATGNSIAEDAWSAENSPVAGTQESSTIPQADIEWANGAMDGDLAGNNA